MDEHDRHKLVILAESTDLITGITYIVKGAAVTKNQCLLFDVRTKQCRNVDSMQALRNISGQWLLNRADLTAIEEAWIDLGGP